MVNLVLKINGAELHLSAAAEESLLSVLRNRLNLTGTSMVAARASAGHAPSCWMAMQRARA